MIKIKIAEMLGKHKMTRKELAELTGIRAGTVGKLYDETIQRIEVEWLDKLCKLFDCSLTDIIDYYPDNMIVEEKTFKTVIDLKNPSNKAELIEVTDQENE